MDSENPEDFDPAPAPAEDDPQEIGGLINSDGEEVDFSHLSEHMKALSAVQLYSITYLQWVAWLNTIMVNKQAK